MIRCLALAAAVALLSACPYHVQTMPDAFTRERRAALVLHCADSAITMVTDPYLRAATFDVRPAMLATHPIVLEGLERNRYFTLVPEARVLSAPSYVKASGSFWETGSVMPPGYKYIVDDVLLARIAREVGADLSVLITTSLQYALDGRGMVRAWAKVVEATGRPVWMGVGFAHADDPTDIRLASQERRAEVYRATMRKALLALERTMTEDITAALAPPSASR